MKSIRVVDVLGTPCLLAPEKGDQLAAEIKKGVGLLTSVGVDFSGYQFLSSAFLNHAFGQVCIDQDWSTEKFHKKVKISGLDGDDTDELELAIGNAQTRRSLLKEGITPEQFYSSRLPA